MGIKLIVVALGFLFILIRSITRVKRGTVGVVERLGRYQHVLPQGIHVLVPFIDTVRYRHLLKENLRLLDQGYTSRDGKDFEIQCDISIELSDVKLATYGVADYRAAMVQLARDALRDEIAKTDAFSVVNSKAHLRAGLSAALKEKALAWGIKINEVMIEKIRQV